MVSFGTQGFGWSAAAEGMGAKDGSEFDEVRYFFNELGLNYAYLINKRIQVGGFASFSDEEYKFKTKTGKNSSSVIETYQYGIFSLYNFSDDTMDSYFAGLGVSLTNHEEENSHHLENAEEKIPFELDDKGFVYEFIFGRRFSLKHWNIDHLTFAPQISLYHRNHGKDFDDQRIQNGIGFYFNLIKFDLLF